MVREQLIRLALRALAGLRVSRWLPDDANAAGVVLTLHHVRPASNAAFQPNALLSVTPDFLDGVLRRFKAVGWRFVPVDELLQTGRGGGRLMAVTLDDGYRNNLEYALPVFRKNAVPFTIYVCPGFCDRTAELWWEALERIIAGAASVGLQGAGPGELATETLPQKQQAFRAWVTWLTREADERGQREAIRALAARYGLDLGALARELVMDWNEVRSIAADPLCTIGAHTITHPALARLPAEIATQEMQNSAERIEAEIGVRPTSIAFPYGYRAAAGPREAKLAEQAGFAGSFTTRPGTIRAGATRHGLPRMSLNGLFQEPALMEALVTPGLWKLKNRLRPAA